MSPGRRIFERYSLAVVVIGIVAAILAYAASYAFTPSYSAMSRVIIRGREGRVLSTTGQNLETQLTADSGWSKPLIQTISSLVTSRDVTESVVRDLGLDRPKPGPTTLYATIKETVRNAYYVGLAYVKYGYYAEPPAFEGAVDELQRALTVTNIRDSYIVEIKARADDPEKAREIANAVAKAAVRISREQFRTNAAEYQRFLQGEVERTRTRVADAESAVKQYKESLGIADLAEQLRLAAAGQDAATRSLSDARTGLQEATARESSLRARLEELKPTEQARTTVRGESSGAGSNGRLSQDQEGETPNRVYQDVERLLVTAQADRAAAEARVDANTKVVADRAAAAGQLAEAEARMNGMRLQTLTAQDAYREASTTYSKALLNGANDAEDVSLVDLALAPVYPERPLRYIYALVGLLGGLVAGTALAILLDARRSGSAGTRPRSGSVPSGPVPRPVLVARPSAFSAGPAPASSQYGPSNASGPASAYSPSSASSPSSAYARSGSYDQPRGMPS